LVVVVVVVVSFVDMSFMPVYLFTGHSFYILVFCVFARRIRALDGSKFLSEMCLK
jgi:hypothetical protein